MLQRIDLMRLDEPVLLRASQAFPTPLGTLDALHLASLIRYTEAAGEDVSLATHDQEMATAARALGVEVLGA